MPDPDEPAGGLKRPSSESLPQNSRLRIEFLSLFYLSLCNCYHIYSVCQVRNVNEVLILCFD